MLVFSENFAYILNEWSLLSRFLFKLNNNVQSRCSRVHGHCSSVCFVDFELVFSRRVIYIFHSIFRTISNIYDGVFCERSERLLAVFIFIFCFCIYFCQKTPSYMFYRLLNAPVFIRHRDGSAVEIVGLCKSALRWLNNLFDQDVYKYNNVVKCIAGKSFGFIKLRERCQNTGYFWSVFSPNAGKYGLEITRYLDPFHAVLTPYLHLVLMYPQWYNPRSTL